MSKLVCDICGTIYHSNEEVCPICGTSREYAVVQDEMSANHTEGERFASEKKKKIFDYDAVNISYQADEGSTDPDSYEDEEEDEIEYRESRSVNVFVVILCVILITLLLLGAAFLFLRYYLPNTDGASVPETTETVAPSATEMTEETEKKIPCQSLMLESGIDVLSTKGQFWKLYVMAFPEDTTDALEFSSENESVATVDKDGKITAVGEGETQIVIRCGSQKISTKVTVKYQPDVPEETEEMPLLNGEDAVSSETKPENTVKETEDEPAEVPQDETKPANPSDVTLKLKQVDIGLYVGYGVTLELDCDLKPSDVTWKVEHEHLASVDETGFVKALRSGITAVIVTYGDQQVQCLIRCK